MEFSLTGFVQTFSVGEDSLALYSACLWATHILRATIHDRDRNKNKVRGETKAKHGDSHIAKIKETVKLETRRKQKRDKRNTKEKQCSGDTMNQPRTNQHDMAFHVMSYGIMSCCAKSVCRDA